MSSRSTRRQRQLQREDLPQGGQRLTQVRSVQAQFSSGPLPSAEELERYDDILPGSAERFLAMVEQQAEHRMALETMVIRGGTRRASLGLVGGFILAVLALLIGGYLVAIGRDAIGVGTMIVDVGVLLSAFVYGDIRSRNERRQKR